MNKIEEGLYFITAFQKLPKENFLDTGSSRCFGYYPDFERADAAVRANQCDLHECLYMYAIIERIDWGIHAFAESRWFYEYNLEKRIFEPIEEPESLKHLINFAIG